MVENSLDACELFQILPEVHIRITSAVRSADQPDPKPYLLRVQDNGPGVDPKYVPNAFGRVFFGSKFKLRQARGMFGMGGTMAILYGQITTNRPVNVATSADGKAIYSFDMMIDIQANSPIILKKETLQADGSTGTSVQICLEGDYARAASKIYEYLKQTALAAPYANLNFTDPSGRFIFFKRAIQAMPSPPKETLPHPHGIDVEAFRRLLKDSKEDTLLKFMYNNFHRVGERTASTFLTYSNFNPNARPKDLKREDTVRLVEALHRFEEFLQPDASCLSPLGEEILKTGIIKELQPEFVAVAIRAPSAYSGFPFIVEVGVAYGGKVIGQGLKLLRFANRIPLLYDEASDVAWKVVNEIDLRRYKVPQEAPLAVVTHICSTKIPYKTVGKEYIADRPEIERELRNGIREALRKISIYLSKKGSMEMVKRKMNIYSKYLPLIARFSSELAEAKRQPQYRRLLGEEEHPIEEDVKKEAKTIDMEVEAVGRQKRLEEFTKPEEA